MWRGFSGGGNLAKAFPGRAEIEGPRSVKTGAPRQRISKPDPVLRDHPSHGTLRLRGTTFSVILRPTWTSPGRVVGPTWPCTGRGLPGRRVAATPVRSYRTISPLPVRRTRRRHRLFVSVALSRGFPRVGVTHRLALRCPDFPRGIPPPRSR